MVENFFPPFQNTRRIYPPCLPLTFNCKMQTPISTPVKEDPPPPLECPSAPRRQTCLLFRDTTFSKTNLTDKFFLVNKDDVILAEVIYVEQNNSNMMWKRIDNSVIIETTLPPAQASLTNKDERIISWDEL